MGVRELVAVLLALCVPPPASARMSLDASFPDEVRGDLLVVAREVLEVVAARFRADPPAGRRPYVCFVRPSGPITDSTTDPRRYRIGLSVVDRSYARFVFQLGHELGHVYLDPRRTNGLLETVAVAISLQALDDLATRWARAPPYPHWRSYAPALRRYRERVEAWYLRDLPDEVREAARTGNWQGVTLYLRYRRLDQDRNATDRALNMLGAIALRTQSVEWRSFLGLGSRTAPSPEEAGEFRDDLPIEVAGVAGIETEMRRIGRAPGAEVRIVRPSDRSAVEVGFLFREGETSVWLHDAADH
jgi:hypothetical protein